MWDSGDTQLAIWQRTAALPAGGSYATTNTVTLPGWAVGTCSLIYRVDAYAGGSSYDNQVYEWVETNNTLVVALALVAPDLVATNLTWTGQPVAGQALTVVWTVANLGSAAAQSTWYDAVYFSTNAVLDGPDTQLRLQSHSLALAVGNSYQVTNTVTIPANAPSGYYLILKADDQNAVFEANETNNWRAFGVSLYRDADGDGIPDWWEEQYFGSTRGRRTDLRSQWAECAFWVSWRSLRPMPVFELSGA